MADLNDTFTDFGIQQGAKYLSFNKNKVSTIDGGRIASSYTGVPQGPYSNFGKCGPVSHASKVEGFTGQLSRYGTCNLNVTNTIEGFTGAFGPSEANDRNSEQAQQITQVRDQFNRAKSQYANAQKTLMGETSMFVNNSSDTGPGAEYRNKFVKMSDGSLAFITDRNVLMPVNPLVYEANKGKNGCDPTIVTVPFGPEKGAPVGLLRKAEAKPNFFIGQPLKMGQSCAPTNINLQVLGATDPNANEKSWLGCRKGDGSRFATEQQDISSLTQNADQALERCRIRAADQGSSAFAIGPSSYGGSYGCFTANAGVTTDDIIKKTQLGTVQKVSSTLQSVNGGGLSAGVFFNGQVGMGNIGDNIRTATNVQMWSNSSPFENCDAQTGASIDVLHATYGASCNGRTNPIAVAAAQAEANARAFAGYEAQQAKQAAKAKAAALIKAAIPI